MKSQRIEAVLLLTGGLFVVLYLILAWNNRIPFEDYNFIFRSGKYGPIPAMILVYETYSARWSAHSLSFIFSGLWENRYFLFSFNLITLGILFTAVYGLLKKILSALFSDHTAALSGSVLVCTGLFFSSYGIGETWFWYMVNWMYLWSLIATFFLFSLLLHKKPNWLHSTAIILLSAYIAGAAESYALITIVFLSALSAIKYMNKRIQIIDGISNTSLHLALVSLCLLYLITLFAPGTSARQGMIPDAGLIERCIMLFKSFGILLIRKTPLLLPYILLFSVPWMAIGAKMRSGEIRPLRTLLPILFKGSLALAAILFILNAPASWVLYDICPDRALGQVSLTFIILFSAFFFFIGSRSAFGRKNGEWLSVAVLIAGLLFISYTIVDQHKITTRFSKAYDSRIELVKREVAAGRTKALLVEPLPPSGMLHCGELTADTTRIQYFERVFCPDFRVVVKNR